MKYKYLASIILLGIINFTSLFSQDIVDPPKLENTLLNLQSDFINRDFNKFKLGWNFSSPNNIMDSLLKINYICIVRNTRPDWIWRTGIGWWEEDNNWYYFGRPLQTNPDYSDNTQSDFYDPTIRPAIPDYLWYQNRIACNDEREPAPVLFGLGYRFNPAITVDSLDSFVPDINNVNGTVFGWTTKSLGISNNTAIPGTIKLRQSSITSEQVVLKDIWKDYEIYHRPVARSVPDRQNYDGDRWILDVHIKADVSNIPAEVMDQTVLKIEVPYIFNPASYIATSGNKLLRTRDNGSTWEKYDFDASLQFNCKSMYFSSYQHGFLCGSNGQFFETEDAGEKLVQDKLRKSYKH